MKEMLKELLKNKWYIACGVFGIFALACFVIYAMSLNFLSALAAFLFIGGGFGCYFKGKTAVDKGATVTVIPPTPGQVNCMRIYCITRNGVPSAHKILFENVPEDELVGDRWYFEDIRQWLHVMYNDIENPDTWKEFDLPDEKYTHPGRLAWVLNQSDYEEFMQIEATMFEKLKPLIMIGANALVLFFIFLVSSGAE